ncbi:MAG: alpha/beta hydrolase [Bacteroidia bacterium]|jgi:3-oxoadipate enol-lactonase|nr:alpha/beta hydrolase [Bacteroidia bacterium]
MEFVVNDGITLYYELSGKPDSEYVLVFLNGLSQSTVAWTGIAPAFAGEYAVLLVDLADQGRSGSSAVYRSYDAHAADVAALLQHVNAGRAILVGISYGSAVAQHLLVNHAQLCAGALLLSTFAHSTAHFEAIGECWKAALLAGGYALMLDVMLPTVLGKTYFEKPFIPIATLKESRVAANLQPERLLRLMQATENRGDYRNTLCTVKAPVSVVQGEEDILIPPDVARQVADAIPDAEFTVIERAGHTLNLEAIPQTIGALRKLLERVELRSTQAEK